MHNRRMQGGLIVIVMHGVPCEYEKLEACARHGMTRNEKHNSFPV